MSDALHILDAAVAVMMCEPCICDVDGEGTIAASDALLTLEMAVGELIGLSCPRCV